MNAPLPHGLIVKPIVWGKPKPIRYATEHRREVKSLKRLAKARGERLKPFMRSKNLEAVSHWFFNKANG